MYITARVNKMSKKMKALLIGFGAIIVIAILLGAYVALQPKVKWWKPATAMEKPNVDFSKLNSTVVFIRTPQDNDSIDLSTGNVSSDGRYASAILLSLRWYDFHGGGYDDIVANLTAYAERLKGDYILQKLIISYQYGSEDEYGYTDINYVSTAPAYFQGTNLWFDRSYNKHGGDNMIYQLMYEHRMVAVNKDKINTDFYGVSFDIEILLLDSLSQHLNHTIIFTVTAYYGHPSLLGWQDMHELKTEVVLKIVPGGEKE